MVQPPENPEIPEMPVEEVKPLEPEYFDKDQNSFYRIGGRVFRIDKVDVEKETPVIVECNGKRKHVLLPKKQRFIDISGYTDEELQDMIDVIQEDIE